MTITTVRVMHQCAECATCTIEIADADGNYWCDKHRHND